MCLDKSLKRLIEGAGGGDLDVGVIFFCVVAETNSIVVFVLWAVGQEQIRLFVPHGGALEL